MTLLRKEQILDGLRRLDAFARAEGMLIDLSVYGGAALALVFDLRLATKDVDAVVRGNPDFLRSAVKRIAEEENWPEDWLNDGVKGFLSANEELLLLREFPGTDGGLRVYVPSPEYIFAMKCMAMRPEGMNGSHDISDIKELASIMGISCPDDAFQIIEKFYPSNRISPKVAFGVAEILERIQKEKQK